MCVVSWVAGEAGWLWSLQGYPPSIFVLADPGREGIISDREVMLRPREWRRLMDVPLPLELLPLMTDAPAPVSAVALVVGGTGGGVVTLTGASVWSTEDLKKYSNK